jgi:hypothetical protein
VAGAREAIGADRFSEFKRTFYQSYFGNETGPTGAPKGRGSKPC